MLNPDGVSRGHYRTDQKGVNLNRVYLNPDFESHPSIYASRSLILFYHHYYRVIEEETNENASSQSSGKGKSSPRDKDLKPLDSSPGKVSPISVCLKIVD